MRLSIPESVGVKMFNIKVGFNIGPEDSLKKSLFYEKRNIKEHRP
jgi:hypothetical protein